MCGYENRFHLRSQAWMLYLRIAAGSLVSIYWKKEFLGCGFYDPHSPLRVRLVWWPGDGLTPGSMVSIDRNARRNL